MNQVKIGGACLNQTPIDWDTNFQNIKSAIEDSKAAGVNILCLPELCITSYGCQDLFLHDWVIHQAYEQLNKIVPLSENIAIAVGLPLIHDGKTYNTICVLANGKILGFYAKQFLANDGIHYEKRWFEPWPKNTLEKIVLDGQTYSIGDQTFILSGLRVGFEICEDAWSEDRPACRLYEKGVDLILNPSASHFSFGKVQTREELVIESSRRFECAYLYVNQLGNESGRVVYDGDILFADHGKLILQNKRLSFKSFNLLYYEVGSDKINLLDSFNSSNEEFPQVEGLALFDYLRKSRSKGYVLSLSGGADSSSIAVLVAEMVNRGVAELGTKAFCEKLDISLGNEKEIVNQLLFTAYQGTKNSSKETLESAQKLAESIGAEFAQWRLDEILEKTHDTIEKVLGRKLSWDEDDIALQNIQARSRSPLIWMMANIRNSILLTTSNRSEGDVGYTTMDGDTSGSLAPIAGVDKPFIVQWLRYAEKELGYVGLKYVNSLTPTAELRPQDQSQTDESDLMPYPILERIERLGISQRKSPIEVFEILKNETDIEKKELKKYITKFYKLWSINQWKRERLAPSFHIDDFNVDPKTWCRFPILSGGFEKELNALSDL